VREAKGVTKVAELVAFFPKWNRQQKGPPEGSPQLGNYK
jgi:hypothetical protein